MNPKTLALIEKARAAHAARLAEGKARELKSQAPESSVKSAHGENMFVPTALSEIKVRPPVHVHPGIRTEVPASNVLYSSVSSITGLDLNKEQASAVELAMRQKSFCLCGAAGSGKTTTTREIVGQVVRLPFCEPLKTGTKYFGAGSPSIAIVSFTNKAVNNIKKQLPEALRSHCRTIHKFLEYGPVRAFDPYVLDQLGWRTATKEGTYKYPAMFMPQRNILNKLPHFSVIVVEESSMVDVVLFNRLIDALPYPDQTQFIFLGDLNQLPPLFDPSILGYKIVELPVVELTHIYRQALESPIITLAHKIREGLGYPGRIESQVVDNRGEHGVVTIRPWAKKIDSEHATKVILRNLLIPLVDSTVYDPSTTQILCPFNKGLGTIALNKGIAHHLTKKRGEKTYEVIARYSKTYWAVGDRVIVDKQEGIIVSIEDASGYDGAIPKEPSFTMDRYGHEPNEAEESSEEETDDSIDALERMMSMDLKYSEDGETQNEASHTIKVQIIDSGDIYELSSAGQINSMLLSYVITIHKSQGSEWENVYLILHYSHNTMLTRELLYTAVTRAKRRLYIACEPDRGHKGEHRPNSITRAAKNPEIVGVTLAEKAEYFQAKKQTYKRGNSAEKSQRDLPSMGD